MNAITETEIQALAVAPLAVADATRDLILLELPQLLARRSQRNARRTPRQSIPELAASIARVGLLQNLIVVLADDGEHYEVVAGDRRLTALKLLAKKKRIPTGYQVVCLLVPDASARTVSLAENLLREQMHPADQFEAFASLVNEGRGIEDIAADFGVSPLVVQRRLKLANVSPRLLADYRADAVTMEQLMAVSITDDHAAQEAAFYEAPDWQRSPAVLRERLTEREIDATHPLVRFAGLEAYNAAGGGLRRDLFAEGEAGTYLLDAALLDSLVRTKLEVLAEDVRAEGWAWVETVPQLSPADQHRFQRAPQQRREPRAREARRLAALQSRLDKLDVALDQHYAAEADKADEDEAVGLRVATLEQQREQVIAERKAIEQGLLEHAPDVRALAGAIVTVQRDGTAYVHRGLLREAEAKALRAVQRVRQGAAVAGSVGEGGSEMEEGQHKPPLNVSDRLAQRLSAHRTAALQVEVARHPQVALAAVVHRMVQSVLQSGSSFDALPIGVRPTLQNRLEASAPDWAESRAAVALRELQEAAGETLPHGSAELFAALLAKSQDELVRLLAVCTAQTVDVVTARAQHDVRGNDLARAAGLDMAAWWRPTAEGYFVHVPKAAILAAVGEFAPSHVDRLAKLKKAEIASEAERLAEGTGWMPVMFRQAADAQTADLSQRGEPEAKPAAADLDE